MTTNLGKKYLSDQNSATAGSDALSSAPRDRTSDLVSHLVQAVNSQIQADADLEKFRIASAADVEKDNNSRYYTLMGTLFGVFGL